MFPIISKIDEDTITSLKFIGLLEKQGEKIKKELSILKNIELERIFKEFLMNDYERRFSTSLDQVISALIGEDQTAAEFAHQSRLQKVFFWINFRLTINQLKYVKLLILLKTQKLQIKIHFQIKILI